MMMNSFRLIELAEAISARIIVQDNQTANDSLEVNVEANRINTDTRSIEHGDVFLALRGDRFDGHHYVQQAQEKGAVAAIVDEKYISSHNSQELLKTSESVPLPLIVVNDTLKALADSSLWNRKKFMGPVIAITGSAGKTSVKSMVAHIMQSLGSCWATPGNFNNHIGAPLTLLGLKPSHASAVIELGASGEGEIAYTAQLAKPDVAIITNVSGAHLEGFGCIETIVRTKGEIIDALSSDGCAVLNADDIYYTDWVIRAADRSVISFGITNYADVMATDIICDENGSRFNVVYKQNQMPCEIPLLGQHNVLNALSAIAACLAVNLDLSQIIDRLKTLPMVDGRLQWVDGDGGIKILNDSYNASPASVKAGIDVLALWKDNACLVLGDMAELGKDSAAIHAEIGEYARQKGIAHFVATGSACRHAVDAFNQSDNAHWFEEQSELLKYLNKYKQPGQVFLVKGSRSAGMDKVVTALSVNSAVHSISEEEF